MSVNNLYHLDSNYLKDYYRYELDWVLLPESLRKVSIHLRTFCLSFFTKITIECYLNSNISVVFFRCAVLKVARLLYPFWPDCTNIILHGTSVCQCPERRLERACHHMDCFRNNYRYASTCSSQLNKDKSYFKPNRNNYRWVNSKPKLVLN